MTENFDRAVSSLSVNLCSILLRLPDLMKLRTQEVRLRCNQPLMITTCIGNMFVNRYGQAEKAPSELTYICGKHDLEESFKSVCEYSVHSYQNEINRGFVTVKGGHRVGICGTAVCENGKIINVKNISSLNLRIAAEHKGAAVSVMSVFSKRVLDNTVIIGAPSSGKTTVLRDIAFQLSSGRLGSILKVCVVDERGELCATYENAPAFDMGCSCDCMCGYGKADGIEIAIRTLSPQVIIFDEIGTSDELLAVTDGFNAGVNIITSVHASSYKDFLNRKIGQMLIKSGAFRYFVFLKGSDKPGQVDCVFERNELLNENSGDSIA